MNNDRQIERNLFRPDCDPDCPLQVSPAGVVGQGRQVPVRERVARSRGDAEDFRRGVRRVEVAAGSSGAFDLRKSSRCLVFHRLCGRQGRGVGRWRHSEFHRERRCVTSSIPGCGRRKVSGEFLSREKSHGFSPEKR